MKLLILLVLLLPLAAGAQVRKCTIDGKTVYSDSQCGQAGQAVTATVNSLDTSGMRDLAAKRSEKESAAQAQARADAAKAKRKGNPGACPGMDGAAYISCIKGTRKPVPKPP